MTMATDPALLLRSLFDTAIARAMPARCGSSQVLPASGIRPILLKA